MADVLVDMPMQVGSTIQVTTGATRPQSASPGQWRAASSTFVAADLTAPKPATLTGTVRPSLGSGHT